MNDELKLCPACGMMPRKLQYTFGGEYMVYCRNRQCDFNQPSVTGRTEEEAVKKWNTRPLEARLQARIEKLKKALKEIKNNKGFADSGNWCKQVASRALEADL